MEIIESNKFTNFGPSAPERRPSDPLRQRKVKDPGGGDQGGSDSRGSDRGVKRVERFWN